MAHFLGFDLETGGLDRKTHTITEAYFAIWNEKWELLEDIHLYLKNDNGEVIGEKEAFDITGINPEEHLKNPDTLTYTEGRTKLLEMLKRHKIPRKRIHYRLLGQNISLFDIPFMQEQGFLTESQSKKAGIAHNCLDSTSIVTWLKSLDILPSNVGNLSSLVEFFGLPKGTAHRAKDDVHMQKDVYIKLCELMKNNMKANLQSQGQDNDLLKIVEL
jgi:DNA polymerase III epsilon subunit-like protein